MGVGVKAGVPASMPAVRQEGGWRLRPGVSRFAAGLQLAAATVSTGRFLLKEVPEGVEEGGQEEGEAYEEDGAQSQDKANGPYDAGKGPQGDGDPPGSPCDGTGDVDLTTLYASELLWLFVHVVIPD